MLIIRDTSMNFEENQKNSFPFAGILGISQKQLQWGWEDPKSDRGGIYKQGWWRLQYLWGMGDKREGTWWGYCISMTVGESHSNLYFYHFYTNFLSAHQHELS